MMASIANVTASMIIMSLFIDSLTPKTNSECPDDASMTSASTNVFERGIRKFAILFLFSYTNSIVSYLKLEM